MEINSLYISQLLSLKLSTNLIVLESVGRVHLSGGLFLYHPDTRTTQIVFLPNTINPSVVIFN